MYIPLTDNILPSAIQRNGQADFDRRVSNLSADSPDFAR